MELDIEWTPEMEEGCPLLAGDILDTMVTEPSGEEEEDEGSLDQTLVGGEECASALGDCSDMAAPSEGIYRGGF